MKIEKHIRGDIEVTKLLIVCKIIKKEIRYGMEICKKNKRCK